MEFRNHLRAWREAEGLSREQLAEKLSISAVSVFRIERGQQQPRPQLLDAITAYFKRSAGDFYRAEPNVSRASLGTRRVRILDFVQAGDFMVISEGDNLADDSVLTDSELSADGFALRIRGRSMAPDFQEGDVVVIDPAVQPRAEDCVVAVDENGEATFKRFHDLGLDERGRAVFELVSINPAYPAWRSDRKQLTIRGTMIEHRRFRARTLQKT